MLRFDKARCLSLLFKFFFVFFGRLGNYKYSEFINIHKFKSEFLNIVFILYYNFIEFIIPLYTFLVICFTQYKEYMISQISFINFLGALPFSTCARTIRNL